MFERLYILIGSSDPAFFEIEGFFSLFHNAAIESFILYKYFKKPNIILILIEVNTYEID